MNEQVIDFLKGNPNSDKAAIIAGTGIKGLPLYNFLKKAVTAGQIISAGEENNPTYSLNEKYTEEVTDNQSGATENEEPKETIADEGKKEDTLQPPAETKTTKAETSRDNSKYKFNNELYGKGPLVRAVVAHFVSENNPSIKKLREVFPDDLLKRYGIFQEVEKARELSGKRDRYFFKAEHVIKLADKKSVVVCSQITATNILPFLKIAKELYKIK